MNRNFKRILSVLLTIIVFSANDVFGSDTILKCRAYSVVQTIAEPLSPDAYGTASPMLTADSLEVQDCVDFMENRLTYEGMSTSGRYQVRKFKGSADQYEIYQKYVDCLANQPNLEQVESYTQSYSTIYFSVGFNYTGTRAVPDTTLVTFTDTPATLMIWGSVERNKLEFSVWIPASMTITDLGYRFSGEDAIPELAGPSAYSGLELVDHTTFRTSDGRLSTELGKATVLHDGRMDTGKVEFERNEKLERDAIIVSDYYRNLGFLFAVVAKSEGTGDIYTEREMSLSIGYDPTSATLREILDFRHQRFFGAVRGEKTVFAVDNANSIYRELTVRIMYYSEGSFAVYYVYAKFIDEPTELEALIAADLSVANIPPSQTDATYSIKPGESLTLGTELESAYTPTFELFRWELLSGVDVVTLEGIQSSNCKITGTAEGEAVVRSTYTWGGKELDALGFVRSVTHERIRTYTILCSQDGSGGTIPPEDPPKPPVEPEDVHRGDMNSDDKLDSNDAIYLLRHTMNNDRYPITQSGDMNGDGKVDSNDAIYLLRHTMDKDRFPLKS